jgi:hypothetical protein
LQPNESDIVMSSRRPWLAFGVVAVPIALAVGLSYSFLHDALGLRPFSIRVMGLLLIFVVVVAILWRGMLREWARRPDGSDSRKNDKQRS